MWRPNKKQVLWTVGTVSGLILVTGLAVYSYQKYYQSSPGQSSGSALSVSLIQSTFGDSVKLEVPDVKINLDISKDFSVEEATQLAEFEQQYGFKLTDVELKNLSDRKFVIKSLLDTSIRPSAASASTREFSQLYTQVQGEYDVHDRKLTDAKFYSADVFMQTYGLLYTELLREMENKVFFGNMKRLTEQMYKAAEEKKKSATGAEQVKWEKVRNYFAVPYVIFHEAAIRPDDSAYQNADGSFNDPQKMAEEFAARDEQADKFEKVQKFADSLGLDEGSLKVVQADLKNIYDASAKAQPAVFANEYTKFANDTGINVEVDFSQFTPRGTYTSSSLRRQYFRAIKWYIMIPFLVKSPELTTYAFGATQLLAESPESIKAYGQMEAAINFLIGGSDDLVPADYLAALQVGRGKPEPSAAAMEYLLKARDPMIKDLSTDYAAIGVVGSDEARLSTKGLRFFSGKFIIDSYWTGYLTQGDEAPRPGYTQKLPPMASVLEVMSLLGSDYAKSAIPQLDFYKPSTKEAIDKAVAELSKQTNEIKATDWQSNIYMAWLDTIRSVFSWQQKHKDQLPRFMQSDAWAAKTLMSASSFWTQLRHATVLYAKQSMAELGGGGDTCLTQPIPVAAKSYIEPQPETYARLIYMAKRTNVGLKELGFDLVNSLPLERYVTMMEKVQDYTIKQLGNAQLNEKILTKTRPDPEDENKVCKEQYVEDGSDWEYLRTGLVGDISTSQPVPTEGPVLRAVDKRAAIVTDVHTGGDSSYPKQVLYQGVGVPAVILTVVKDTNGPRLTIGFVSTHYEFTEPAGQKRMTDEQWQEKFYQGDDTNDAFNYTGLEKWPEINSWYKLLFEK